MLTDMELSEAQTEIERAGRFVLEGKDLLAVIHLECALGIIASSMRGRETGAILVDMQTGDRVNVNPVT
jgi:hypothetical protein